MGSLSRTDMMKKCIRMLVRTSFLADKIGSALLLSSRTGTLYRRNPHDEPQPSWRYCRAGLSKNIRLPTRPSLGPKPLFFDFGSRNLFLPGLYHKSVFGWTARKTNLSRRSSNPSKYQHGSLHNEQRHYSPCQFSPTSDESSWALEA